MTDTTQTLPTRPVGIDAETPLKAVLYTRSDISAVSRRQIAVVADRLRTLTETPLVDEVQREQWPPQQAVTTSDGTSQSAREELLSEFEDWASQHRVSLRPAIRREVVPSSLLGTDDSDIEIRVPVMTLALYTTETDTEVQGVVPYTTNPGTDEAETYTVGDWLSTVEAEAAGTVSQQVSSLEEDSTA